MIYTFEGIFTEYIKGFIEQKHALGYLYRESERILFTFQQFCKKNFSGETALTQEMASQWTERRASENNLYRLNRVSVVREFARYLSSIGVDAYLIPIELTRKTQRHVPHIYTMDELSALFRSMDATKYNPRTPAMHLIVPVIYRLIYCCGLRPIEARRLLVNDVDLNTGAVKILESKGHKDRLIMLSDDVLELCRKYNQRVELIYPERQHFFHSHRKGGMLSEPWITKTFKKHLVAIGLEECAGNNPRLYDLRHTFATHRLYQWMCEGADVNACLPYLSEYMGHKLISDTAYYIHLVPEFFPKMAEMQLDSYTTLIPEVRP